ncbi:hypothetical protein DFH07DRAFT_779699 [Mycena maculata]|uniref:Uncharacterized protein n=1 Tax=Mycena maculata TaxID=230809 RepID=A0AAD7I8E9_9AGAR|nr:hypothetical protein DFH07DRAFT_779699 [Mycena maculata]
MEVSDDRDSVRSEIKNSHQCEQSAQESDDQESVGSETQRLSHNGDVNLARDEGNSEVGEFGKSWNFIWHQHVDFFFAEDIESNLTGSSVDNGKWRYRSESLERRSVGSEMSLIDVHPSDMSMDSAPHTASVGSEVVPQCFDQTNPDLDYADYYQGSFKFNPASGLARESLVDYESSSDEDEDMPSPEEIPTPSTPLPHYRPLSQSPPQRRSRSTPPLCSGRFRDRETLSCRTFPPSPPHRTGALQRRSPPRNVLRMLTLFFLRILRPILRVNPSLRASQQRPLLTLFLNALFLLRVLHRPSLHASQQRPVLILLNALFLLRVLHASQQIRPVLVLLNRVLRRPLLRRNQQQSPAAPKSSRQIIRIDNIRARKRSCLVELGLRPTRSPSSFLGSSLLSQALRAVLSRSLLLSDPPARGVDRRKARPPAVVPLSSSQRAAERAEPKALPPTPRNPQSSPPLDLGSRASSLSHVPIRHLAYPKDAIAWAVRGLVGGLEELGALPNQVQQFERHQLPNHGPRTGLLEYDTVGIRTGVSANVPRTTLRQA